MLLLIMNNHKMKNQWDEIASDNALYGVLSLKDFENQDDVDINKFWDMGKSDVNKFMNVLKDFSDIKTTSELSMIEIGCGVGRMTHYFSKLFRKVYAIDVSSEMINRARNYWRDFENIEWVIGNGTDLHQISNKSIDFVFSFIVLQHIPYPEVILNYIRESARVLNNGGIALLQFRTVPQGINLTASKYYISKHCPPLIFILRKVWDTIKGYNVSTKTKYARKYESWLGCALKTSVIERFALELNLQIKHKSSLGKQYTYYIFRKK